MEKKTPNKSALEASQWLLNNSDKIDHSIVISKLSDGSLHIFDRGNTPVAILALIRLFFTEYVREKIFAQAKPVEAVEPEAPTPESLPSIAPEVVQ